MQNLMWALEMKTRTRYALPYRKVRHELLMKPSPRLREKVQKIFSGFQEILGHELDDFQKISLLYQMICRGGTYDQTMKKSLSYSFFGALKGLAVCKGYAELFFLLVGELTDTYRPYLVIGYTANDSEDGHAWVILRDQQGKAWQCDPTWDLGKAPYRYFFLTDSQMSGRIWCKKYFPACEEPFSGKMYKNPEKLNRLLEYYKSLTAFLES